MTRAILFYRGNQLNIYTFEKQNRNEVKDFLSRINDKKLGGYIRGFIDLIDRLADEGPKVLNNNLYDCWKVRDHLFCELIKGKWRIGCFPIYKEKKIILVSVFRKYGWKESRQYQRTIRYMEDFLINPNWDDEE